MIRARHARQAGTQHRQQQATAAPRPQPSEHRIGSLAPFSPGARRLYIPLTRSSAMPPDGPTSLCPSTAFHSPPCSYLPISHPAFARLPHSFSSAEATLTPCSCRPPSRAHVRLPPIREGCQEAPTHLVCWSDQQRFSPLPLSPFLPCRSLRPTSPWRRRVLLCLPLCACSPSAYHHSTAHTACAPCHCPLCGPVPRPPPASSLTSAVALPVPSAARPRAGRSGSGTPCPALLCARRRSLHAFFTQLTPALCPPSPV